jgi:hypothetical protein
MQKAWDVVAQNWYLGFTAFGGPPVHFKIVRFPLSSLAFLLFSFYRARYLGGLALILGHENGCWNCDIGEKMNLTE